MIWTGTSTHIIKSPEKQKKPVSKRLACCVDQTHKFSNLLEDIRKVDRFAQYIESQENGNLTEMEGSQMKSSKM